MRENKGNFFFQKKKIEPSFTLQWKRYPFINRVNRHGPEVHRGWPQMRCEDDSCFYLQDTLLSHMEARVPAYVHGIYKQNT